MSGYVEQGEVVRNEQIGSDVWVMDIHAPKQAAEAKVGQFCNVRVADSTAPLLRRPISYAGFDAQKGTITLLYRVVGKGTEIMTHLVPGDTLDCLGPLGEPFIASRLWWRRYCTNVMHIFPFERRGRSTSYSRF